MLNIRDLNGNKIEITDLDKAAEIAEYFKDLHHIPPVEADKERQAYWRDMHEKLTALKERLKHEENN